MTTREPFYVHCGDCSHEWAPGFAPMPITTFAKIGKSPCPMCGKRKVLIGRLPKATGEGDPIAWVTNGDTGLSSMTIWSVMMGRRSELPSVPWDPADFGRCYRLLKVMPSWRARLPEVAEKHPEWRPLVEAWDELTALYEEELPKNRAPKLYERMKALTRGAFAP